MPGLSGHLVDLVGLVYLVDLATLFKFAQLNKRDKPNKLNNSLLVVADFLGILL